MTNEKQKRHAKRVAKRALKNRRRRNQLVTFWNRYGGQLKAEERSEAEKVITNFIKDKIKEPSFNDTIDVIPENNSEIDSETDENASNSENEVDTETNTETEANINSSSETD